MGTLMVHPPPLLGGLTVLQWSPIDHRQRATGRCSHVVLGQMPPTVEYVAICGGGADGGFFLFRCDRTWAVFTDTWHQTVAEAIHQAEAEFDGLHNTWITCSGPRRALDLDAIELHVVSFFQGHHVRVCAGLPPPRTQLLDGFRVLHLGPGPKANFSVYVTVGAASCPSASHLEFILCSSEPLDSLVETLAMAAYYHLTERLDVGHTLPVGRPIVPGASTTHLLVSRPYPLAPEIEHLSLDGHSVRFVWLMPIHESEAKFLHSFGLTALEEKFEAQEIDILDPRRAPVA